MKADLPMVSVCMITYNHEDYIEKALQSVVDQNYAGPIEVVIGDDASTDHTKQRILKFAGRHTDISWNLKMRDKNVGISRNFTDVLFSCEGEFIAMLEGDDYWVDSFKLTKQVEALQENPNASICFSLCEEVDENNGQSRIIGKDRPLEFSINYLLRNGWFMRTPTLLFRNQVVKNFPDWFYTSYSTDYILQVLLAQKGKVVKVDEVTAAYRKHDGGISVTGFKNQIERYKVKYNLLDTINDHLGGAYQSDIAFQKDMIYAQLVLDSIRRGSINRALLSMVSIGGITAFFQLMARKVKSLVKSK